MYATADDINRVVPKDDIDQITDDEITGEAATVIVERALSRADNIINSYLAGRYTTPLVLPPPGLIRDIAVDLAVYFLYTRTIDDKVAESIRNRYTDAIALLGRIEKGSVRLDVEIIPTDSTRSIFATNKQTCDRVWTKARRAQMNPRMDHRWSA